MQAKREVNKLRAVMDNIDQSLTFLKEAAKILVYFGMSNDVEMLPQQPHNSPMDKNSVQVEVPAEDDDDCVIINDTDLLCHEDWALIREPIGEWGDQPEVTAREDEGRPVEPNHEPGEERSSCDKAIDDQDEEPEGESPVDPDLLDSDGSEESPGSQGRNKYYGDPRRLDEPWPVELEDFTRHELLAIIQTLRSKVGRLDKRLKERQPEQYQERPPKRQPRTKRRTARMSTTRPSF